jgi:hypothetical protein
MNRQHVKIADNLESRNRSAKCKVKSGIMEYWNDGKEIVTGCGLRGASYGKHRKQRAESSDR